jgi:hypothetical protein
MHVCCQSIMDFTLKEAGSKKTLLGVRSCFTVSADNAVLDTLGRAGGRTRMAEDGSTQIITTLWKEIRRNLRALRKKLQRFAWGSEAGKDGVMWKWTLHGLPKLCSPLGLLVGDCEEIFAGSVPAMY